MECTEEMIYDLITRYLRRERSLEEFRDEFVHLTPRFAWDPDTPLGDLLGDVELRYAEETNGDLSEDEFRDELHQLVAVRSQ